MSNEARPPRPARPLSGDELADLHEQFAECDANGDGRIDFTEFTKLLENLGSTVPPAKQRGHFDSIDLDTDGAIDRNEFMQWWRGS